MAYCVRPLQKQAAEGEYLQAVVRRIPGPHVEQARFEEHRALVGKAVKAEFSMFAHLSNVNVHNLVFLKTKKHSKKPAWFGTNVESILWAMRSTEVYSTA